MNSHFSVTILQFVNRNGINLALYRPVQSPKPVYSSSTFDFYDFSCNLIFDDFSGEYEYIDVIVNGERFLIDVDFRSEFEIARQTSGYKELLEFLPLIFVGKSDQIRQIVSMVSEAAKQSLKKNGMHFPPWRKADYMRAKWLSSYTRDSGEKPMVTITATAVAEPELIFEEKFLSPPLKSSSSITSVGRDDDDVAEPVKREAKVVTGLALLFKENP